MSGISVSYCFYYRLCNYRSSAPYWIVCKILKCELLFRSFIKKHSEVELDSFFPSFFKCIFFYLPYIWYTQFICLFQSLWVNWRVYFIDLLRRDLKTARITWTLEHLELATSVSYLLHVSSFVSPNLFSSVSWRCTLIKCKKVASW